jgi:hypothetical protein
MDQQGQPKKAADILGFIISLSSSLVIGISYNYFPLFTNFSFISHLALLGISFVGFADLSVLPLGEDSDLNYHSGAWHGSVVQIDFKETHSRTNDILNKQSMRAAGMSEKELKIRNELEIDIERDLEEEIKDGIYHHALRLHRLYQQQKERNAKKVVPGFETRSQQRSNNTTLLEVNISIRMEGGTKIEIKETKKEAPDHEKGPRARTSRSEKMQAPPVPTTKKFDWVKTLRSNAGPAVSLHQAKTLSNNHCCYSNLNLNNRGRIFGQPRRRW